MKKTEVQRHLKYTFTIPELENMSRTLARTVQDRPGIEREKTVAMSFYKEKLETNHAEVSSLARKIQDGHEYRLVECRVEFHKPDVGFKQIIRTDTGELVAEEKMNDAEKQEQLPFKAEDKPNGKSDSASA